MALLLIAPDGRYEVIHEFALGQDSHCLGVDLLIDPDLNLLYYIDPLNSCMASIVDIENGEVQQTTSMSIPWEYRATLRKIRP